MSERGRGSGPHGEDADGEDAARERPAVEFPPPPTQSRPIAPYDPYRPPSGDAPRPLTRNIAADPFVPPRSSRVGGDDPFLPDDDPLSADAWQLELDEGVAPTVDDATLLDSPREAPPPRRSRRQPPATRGRESATARSTRRARGSTASGRGRATRGAAAVSLGVPRVVAGSSLAADQTAVLLLGINGASILIMALLLGVRLGGMPSPTVLRLDAAGNPNRWGPPSVLWQLPLMAFFLTLMFLVIAWFLHPVDRFAARFALGAAAVAQAIAWVAVIQHIA